MTSPRFHLGEVAITTHNKFSENRGKVVILKEYIGQRYWPEIKEPQHVWIVECMCEDSYLYYLYPHQRELSRNYGGPMPECFLKRITPECGQGILDLGEVPKEVTNSDASV